MNLNTIRPLTRLEEQGKRKDLALTIFNGKVGFIKDCELFHAEEKPADCSDIRWRIEQKRRLREAREWNGWMNRNGVDTMPNGHKPNGGCLSKSKGKGIEPPTEEELKQWRTEVADIIKNVIRKGK